MAGMAGSVLDGCYAVKERIKGAHDAVRAALLKADNKAYEEAVTLTRPLTAAAMLAMETRTAIQVLAEKAENLVGSLRRPALDARKQRDKARAVADKAVKEYLTAELAFREAAKRVELGEQVAGEICRRRSVVNDAGWLEQITANADRTGTADVESLIAEIDGLQTRLGGITGQTVNLNLSAKLASNPIFVDKFLYDPNLENRIAALRPAVPGTIGTSADLDPHRMPDWTPEERARERRRYEQQSNREPFSTPFPFVGGLVKVQE